MSDILSGVVTPALLVTMSAEDMATPRTREKRREKHQEMVDHQKSDFGGHSEHDGLMLGANMIFLGDT
jgi:hypothetical protein